MQQYCFGIVSAICSEVSETPTEFEILNSINNIHENYQLTIVCF